jgi:hypothetical protein
LGILADTLNKESELYLLTSSTSEALKRIAALRVMASDTIETSTVSKTRSLFEGIQTKVLFLFLKKKFKKDESPSEEVLYQLERRDYEYLNSLKNLSKSYISFFNEGLATFEKVEEEIAKIEAGKKKRKPRRLEAGEIRNGIFGVGIEYLPSPIPEVIDHLMDYIEDNCKK